MEPFVKTRRCEGLGSRDFIVATVVSIDETQDESRRAFDAHSRIVFVFIASVFLALTSWLASVLNIWQDEWYSLRTSSRDLAFAWSSALQFEGIPPLYPLVLTLWRHVDASVFFARALSMTCVAIAAWIGWRFAERFLPRISPAFVATAIAFNPFSIVAAVEIRLYAMSLVFATATIATFFAAFMTSRSISRTRDRIAFVVVATLGIYVQYFNAALVVGGFVALVFAGRYRALRAYAIAVAVVALSCSPIALFIGGQIAFTRAPEAMHPKLDIVPLLETATSFAFPHGALENWFSNRANVVYDFGVLLALLAIVLARPRLTPIARGVCGFFVAGVAFYPIATVLTHQTFVYPRHAVILVVPTMLAIFAIIDGATRRRTFALGAYAAIYAACTLAALVVTYHDLAKPGDFARAATFLREHDRDVAAVYAFDQEMVGPLGFYYTNARTIVPLPEPQRFDRFDATRFRFTSADAVRARLGPIARGTRILLYRGDICFDPTDQFGCRFLEDVVRADFRTLASRELKSANVRELVRR